MAVTEAWTDIALLERDRIDTATERGDMTSKVMAFAPSAADVVFNEIATNATGDLADAGAEQASTGAWELQAGCRAVPNSSELFFSEELPDIVAAKAICAACPVIAPCLEGALRRAEPCGVWGGQLFLNGRVQTQKRRRGRPPKVARPEDQLPEVPVPAHLRELIATAGS